MNSANHDRHLIEASKLEFSKKCRRVSLKNIPSGVLNQDILELLKPYFYQQIHIDKNSQSCKAVLLDGESAARCIDDLHGKFFRGQRLSVSLASCDFMLCITHLPLSFSHNQFLSLLAPFGTTERCFLVHSNVTGQSKGYGCVEFTSKESSIKAKNHLNGTSISNNMLQVHWLDTIPSDYSGLYSCCLLVEDLPVNFKDNRLLLEVFSAVASPKFCQLANCEINNFAIVEYDDAMHAEETWYKLSGFSLGSSMLKVSFCVPGPCGLVVLNALKASRDLKRANPSGGLLPTPVQGLDQTSLPGVLHSSKKGITSNIAMSTLDNGLLASKDPEVQRLLATLQNRLVETNGTNHGQLPQYPLQQNINGLSWVQKQLSLNNAVLNQHQQPDNIAPLTMPFRSRSGSISSCDSGARVEDDVFEPARRKSQEDQYNVESHNNQPFLSTTQDDRTSAFRESAYKMHYGQKVDSRNSGFDTSGTVHQPGFPQPSVVNPLLFLREDVQRSESADSAYSGSQGSSASDFSFPSGGQSADRQPPSHNCLSASQLATRHRPGGLLGDAPTSMTNHQFGSSKLSSGIQRYAAPPSTQTSQHQLLPAMADIPKPRLPSVSTSGLLSGGSGSMLFEARSKHNFAVGNGSLCGDGHLMNVETVPVLPRGNSSAFSGVFSNHKRRDLFGGRLPHPDLAKWDQDATKVPLTVYSSDKLFSATFKTVDGFSSLSDSEVNGKQCLSGARPTPKSRRSRQTPNSAFDHRLGADSPTQLQLLGSSLLEGLLGESPRSSGITQPAVNGSVWSSSSNGNCRLLRALNLMSPTDFTKSSPQTPIGVRKRVGGNVLPSPEPSPEAGAYVGQHSQGIGGHYADTCDFAGSLLGCLNGASPSSIDSTLNKRRRSNET